MRPGAQPAGLCSLLSRLPFPFPPAANRSLAFAPPPSSPFVFPFSYQTKNGAKSSVFSFGADEGTCAFAARPGAHRTVVCSLRPYSLFIFSAAQTARSRLRLPHQIPFCSLFPAKQKTRQSGLFVWRRERDLNPWIHSCITRFRIVRVRPLRHLCKMPVYFTINPREMQAICTALSKIFLRCGDFS